LDKCAFL